MADQQEPNSPLANGTAPAELRTAPTNPTEYTGSCHCGTIRYTVNIELNPSNVLKCNCTVCVKYGKLIHMLVDNSALTLLSPTSAPVNGVADIKAALDKPEVREKVGGYQYNTKVVTHYFCKECGVHMFTIGYPLGPERGLKAGLNVNAIEGLDMSGEEWKTAGFYIDGRGDFKSGFSKVPFKGGQW